MKHLFLPVMFFVVAMSSCSKNEPDTDANSTNYESSDMVGLNVYAGTTRGADTSTYTLEKSEYVKLHIYDDGDINEVYTFEFDDDSNAWSQSDNTELNATKIAWSNITFPVTLFSLHDGESLNYLSFDGDSAKYEGYTVTGISRLHSDLVYHASELDAMPTGGTVSAYHKHALSKINFYAATGTTNVYIARVTMVNIDAKGNVTITPATGLDITTGNGVTWVNSEDTFEDYQCFDIADSSAVLFTSSDGEDPIINSTYNGAAMIIPQTTTPATVTSIDGRIATLENTYVEVIYYMTDSNGTPVVGCSSVSARSDYIDYIEIDQTKALFVKGAFPLEYTFAPNKEYDIKLGLGVEGSTGGILVNDYYVDKKGEAVTLSKYGYDMNNNGVVDQYDGKEIDIPGIEEGDYILGNSSYEVNIDISCNSWDVGGSTAVEYTE